MKIEIFKKKKKFKKGGFHTNPVIGWEVVLYTGFLLVAAGLAFGVLLFIRTNGAPSEENMSGGQIKIVKKERLIKTLERFREREERSADIINSTSPVDPSL